MSRCIDNTFIIFLILILMNLKNNVNASTIAIGKAIVPNQCSSLGLNNPLRLKDCSIFKLSKGRCCLLTITLVEEETDDDGVTSMVENYKTACIVLDKIDAKVRNQTSQRYKYLGGDVLIECSQKFKCYSLVFMFFIMLMYI